MIYFLVIFLVNDPCLYNYVLVLVLYRVGIFTFLIPVLVARGGRSVGFQ
jgi:hypothetical protein